MADFIKKTKKSVRINETPEVITYNPKNTPKEVGDDKKLLDKIKKVFGTNKDPKAISQSTTKPKNRGKIPSFER